MKHMVHDALELFIIRIQKAMRCSIARKRVHAILVRKAKELANNERRKIKYTGEYCVHEVDSRGISATLVMEIFISCL